MLLQKRNSVNLLSDLSRRHTKQIIDSAQMERENVSAFKQTFAPDETILSQNVESPGLYRMEEQEDLEDQFAHLLQSDALEQPASEIIADSLA